jgi:hypothetical protein
MVCSTKPGTYHPFFARNGETVDALTVAPEFYLKIRRKEIV